MKEYLRELPEPVFSSCLYQVAVGAIDVGCNDGDGDGDDKPSLYYHDHQMLVDAVGVFLPNDPEGNAKLVFSILDCLPKANRVSFIIVRN